MANYPVANFEASDARPNLGDLAGKVFAEDRRQLNPRKHHVAVDRDRPVHRIDSQGMIPDDDLA